MRVCMLVRNPMVRDARVEREARSLVEGGNEGTVVALRAHGLPEEEERDGVRVRRAVDVGMLAGPTIQSATGEGRARRLPRPPALVWARDRLLRRRFTRAALAEPADVYHAHDLNTLEP